MSDSAEGSEVVYKEVASHPCYRVGDDGSIWSQVKHGYGRTGVLKGGGGKWRKLKRKNAEGYCTVALYTDGKRTNRRVHSLVLESFVGPCPDGMQCLHENDVKDDNRLSNIRWGTPKENDEDSRKNGTRVMGETCGSAVLTNEAVYRIRRCFDSGMRGKREAAKFGLCARQYWMVGSRRCWKHLPEVVASDGLVG